VKNSDDMFSRFDRRVMDRRTAILPRHSPRYVYASCGNKWSKTA